MASRSKPNPSHLVGTNPGWVEPDEEIAALTEDFFGVDDTEPTSPRQAELRKAYRLNVARHNSPYAGVHINSRGELRWLMRHHNWSGDYFEFRHRGRANLSNADFLGANLRETQLAGANLSGANLAHCNLSGANLREADLSGAELNNANLSGALLLSANLTGAKLTVTNLGGAKLNEARMDAATVLNDVNIDVRTQLADVIWNGTSLTQIDWTNLDTLGEEWLTHHKRTEEDEEQGAATATVAYLDAHDAVRANRQLATVLRSQGLNEHADKFAYRAHLLQRTVLRRQRQSLRWVGSLLLDTIAGYGYRPLRAFAAYAVVVLGFMGLYLLNSHFVAPHLSWNEALVLSMSSFHGRGFFNPAISLGDTYAELAAAEAFVGLFIEITFIATFTQRFFAR